ncbi:MAG TPA: hypothetical protein VFT45_07955 [Longimicrobium sp.]|nr:hypothetical protein [Longimicrobium sp.]
MMMIRRVPLLLAATLVLTACGKEEEPAGVIPRDKFVAANVALRSLPDGATPAEKTAALRKHGVTDRQLRAWVNGHARDPQTVAEAWEQIAFRLDSLSNPATHVPPAPPRPAPGSKVPPARPSAMADSVVTALPPPPPQPSKIGEPPPTRPRRQRARVQ